MPSSESWEAEGLLWTMIFILDEEFEGSSAAMRFCMYSDFGCFLRIDDTKSWDKISSSSSSSSSSSLSLSIWVWLRGV